MNHNRLTKYVAALALMLAVLGRAWASPETDSADIESAGEKPARVVAHLYFAAADHSFLMAEEKVLDRHNDLAEFGKTIVNALIEGPKQDLMRTLPKETGVRAVYVADNGIAYIDFTESIRTHHPGGCRLEQLSIYSVVNSLILNIDGIHAVKILIEGRESSTLAGHLDLRFPFSADMLIIR